MPSEMVNQITDAIFDKVFALSYGRCDLADVQELAVIVLYTMYEPTKVMIDAGRAATSAYLDLPLRGIDLERAKYKLRYQAMINAALK
jgi:hypothetical protein